MTSFGSSNRLIQGVVSNLANSFVTAVLAVVISLVVLWTGFNFFLPHVRSITSTSDIRNLIISAVHNETELTTASTTGKATVVIRKVAAVLGIEVGETNLVYEGVAKVRSGLDLSKLEVTNLSPENHSVYVLLPSPIISEVSLDSSRSSVLADYQKGFGYDGGIAIYEEAQREAKARIQQEACANHILEVANANAAELVKGILAKVNFEKAVVETQEPVGSCPMRSA